jgi:hypothetical protein
MKRTLATVSGIAACAMAASTVSSGAATGASQHQTGTKAHARAAAHHCPLPHFGPGRNYHPTIKPGNFTPHITNPYYPLLPGHTYIYSGVSGKHKQRMTDIVSPSTRTKVIDGVRTRIVNDRLVIKGKVRERTSDYYTQDRCGNVWYFGEDTAEYNKHGHLTSTEGSFHAGVDGAQPGVYIQRHPQIGRKFRQEWYPGHAEDVYKAIKMNASRKVPYGTFTHALVTRETDALEPGVVDHKYYGHGVGSILENTVKGGIERLHLVDLLR